MPYVEGFGTWPFGEEWLWEALATVYLPLLRVLRGAPVTVGFTPVLCDQLETLKGNAGERFAWYLEATRARYAADAAAFDRLGETALAAELRRAGGDYLAAARAFDEIGGDVLGAWRRAMDRGRPSSMTSAATHAVLPLLATNASVRLQIGLGIRAHRRRFGEWSGTFWLPECAYAPGLEQRLSDYGTRLFCVDQTLSLGLGALDNLEPIATAAGPIAVPVDWQTVALIWDNDSGYPTAAAYRDHHGRRTLRGLKPWNYAGRPYDHRAALALARRHARDFVYRAIARLDAYEASRHRPGLICCAMDAELIGHWWHEGPEWLATVLSEAHARGLELMTLPCAVDAVQPACREIRTSTWAVTKDFRTWDSPLVANLRSVMRAAEIRVVAAATSLGGSRRRRALVRAVRELLALQASDWAFLTTRATAGDYPSERSQGHAAALANALAAADGDGPVPDPSLRNLAPDLNLSLLSGPGRQPGEAHPDR